MGCWSVYECRLRFQSDTALGRRTQNRLRRLLAYSARRDRGRWARLHLAALDGDVAVIAQTGAIVRVLCRLFMASPAPWYLSFCRVYIVQSSTLRHTRTTDDYWVLGQAKPGVTDGGVSTDIFSCQCQMPQPLEK